MTIFKLSKGNMQLNLILSYLMRTEQFSISVNVPVISTEFHIKQPNFT
jgi:hypothetical protein